MRRVDGPGPGWIAPKKVEMLENSMAGLQVDWASSGVMDGSAFSDAGIVIDLGRMAFSGSWRCFIGEPLVNR